MRVTLEGYFTPTDMARIVRDLYKQPAWWYAEILYTCNLSHDDGCIRLLRYATVAQGPALPYLVIYHIEDAWVCTAMDGYEGWI